jgi:hypothetical protein
MKGLFGVFCLSILIGALCLSCGLHLETVQANNDIYGQITANTTWTRINSPYTLTANVLVNNGVTLKIEAGTTVNLNGFYIMVNGTLNAQGTGTDKITFNGKGYIGFTRYSYTWLDQSGLGCIVENANLPLSSINVESGAPKINNNVVSSISVGGSPTITYNTVANGVYLTSDAVSPFISYNSISGGLRIPYNAAYPSSTITITHNTINNGITIDHQVGTVEALYNTITGGITTTHDWPGQVGLLEFAFNTISGDVILSGSSTVTSNTITGTLIAGFSNETISQNTINAVSPISMGPSATPKPPSSPSGTIGISLPDMGIQNSKNVQVIGNIVSGFTIGISVSPGYSGTTVSESQKALIQGNYVSNCQYGIYTESPCQVEDNVVLNNYYGVYAHGVSSVEKNVIANNYYGLIQGKTVSYNTVTHNTYGILGGAASINFNNIFENSKYNLDVGSNTFYKTSGNNALDATNNWWGTTSDSAISQTIYDYKNDFNLVKVNYTPFLTSADPSAPISSIAPTSTDYPGTPSPSTSTLATPDPNLYKVNSNSTITHFAFDSAKNELSFTVSGTSGTTGYVNVTVAKSALPSTEKTKIFIDDNQVDFDKAENPSFWYLYFTYSHSSHQVKIDLAAAPETEFLGITTAGWVVAAVLVAAAFGVLVLFVKKKKLSKK